MNYREDHRERTSQNEQFGIPVSDPEIQTNLGDGNDSGAAALNATQSDDSRYSWKNALLTALGASVIFFVGFGILQKKDASEENVPPGAVLYAQDQIAAAKDYELKFPVNTNTTKILIWDFAAEDGDKVAIRINGVAGKPFVITNQPQEITVPVGLVEVLGIKDGGGGGVTYAVHFPAILKSIINGTAEGGGNKYTLTTEGGK